MKKTTRTIEITWENESFLELRRRNKTERDVADENEGVSSGKGIKLADPGSVSNNKEVEDEE